MNIAQYIKSRENDLFEDITRLTIGFRNATDSTQTHQNVQSQKSAPPAHKFAYILKESEEWNKKPLQLSPHPTLNYCPPISLTNRKHFALISLAISFLNIGMSS